MKSLLPAVLILLLASPLPATAQPKIIFDTDIGGDADDLGALAMLHNLMLEGECELLAVMSWSNERYAVAAIDAVNRYYGHPEVLIAGRQDDVWHDDWQYNRPVVEALPSELTYEDVPEPTELYRQILADAAESSIVVVTVGPLLNIKRLLESGPDDISPLTGIDLVEAKVEKFVIMGGHFPEGQGEWNFDGNMPGVTRYVVNAIPVPIVFSGYEVGNRIQTGRRLNDIDPGSPLYIGYRHFSEHAPWMKDRFEGMILDNASYDQTAVLYAVRGGVGELWEEVTGGHVEVDENGDNRWIEGPTTNESYLRLVADPEHVADIIYGLMLGKE